MVSQHLLLAAWSSIVKKAATGLALLYYRTVVSHLVSLAGRRSYRRTGRGSLHVRPRRRRRVGSSPVSEQVRLPEPVGVAVSAALEVDPLRPLIGFVYRQTGSVGQLEREARAAR